jgi:IS30 family transposase
MRRQITLNQRYQIAALLEAATGIARNAEMLGYHPSTIYRELNPNSIYSPRGDVYDPDFADKLCRLRHRLKEKSKRLTTRVCRRIQWLIKHKWSPEQIVSVCRDRRLEMISTEGVYQYLYALKKSGVDLCIHLRRKHRKRRKRVNNKQPRVLIKDKVNISKRPVAANKASRCGHMEVDPMKCKNGYLLTMTDRKSNYNIIRRLPNKSSAAVVTAIKNIASLYAKIIKTITSDNDLEFVNHKQSAKDIKAKWFFADPYISQQRGCYENQNGLIRQYFKKDTDLNQITDEQILSVQ